MLFCRKCGESVGMNRTHKCPGFKKPCVSIATLKKPEWVIQVFGQDARELLAIHIDGSVRGSMEDAGEAAEAFVSELRGLTAAIRAEAKAEALNEAYNYGLGRTGHVLHRWLRDRVNQFKEAQVSVSDSVRFGQKYRLKPVMLAKTEQIDIPVTVTRVFRDSGGVEMVKFEPGTYAGNPHGYESLKYFKAKFYQVDDEGNK